jgi:hypothetical protein
LILEEYERLTNGKWGPGLAAVDVGNVFDESHAFWNLLWLNMLKINIWNAILDAPSLAVREERKEDVDVDKGKGEPTVDEACWIYEQLSFLSFQSVFVAKSFSERLREIGKVKARGVGETM